MGFFSWLFKRNKPKTIKLGLALGSGGAKGFAELGALKAFEENQIEFDVVAGTSIGSVIGAFYANGYSSTDMLELLQSLDFSQVTNLFMIQMDTLGLFRVIDKTIGSLDISELKKPFMAVATELETGKEAVFNKGNVAMALCASSSYPPFFKPVVIDDKRYVDGAFTNSLPADLVKNMGADYIVGIDLSNHQPKPSLLQKFIPTFESKVEKPWAKGYEFSNVVIHPNLSAYKATSFKNMHEIYEIGYLSAIEMMPKIKEELSRIKLGKT